MSALRAVMVGRVSSSPLTLHPSPSDLRESVGTIHYDSKNFNKNLGLAYSRQDDVWASRELFFCGSHERRGRRVRGREEKGRREGYEEADRQGRREEEKGIEEEGDALRYSGNVKIVNSFLGRGPKEPFFFQNKIAKEKITEASYVAHMLWSIVNSTTSPMSLRVIQTERAIREQLWRSEDFPEILGWARADSPGTG